MTDTGGVHVDRPDDRIVRIRIDRPPVNALGVASQRALSAAFREADEDLDVRVVVLGGSGRSFCAGADLREEQDLQGDGDDDVDDFLVGLGVLFHRIQHHRVPVVAAVNGAAHGGGLELALACDIRIGCESTSFGAAGVNVGLVANFASLARAVGDARARHLLLTGWSSRGRDAFDAGLVNEFVDDDRVHDRALEVAERIASRAPLSVEATKACLNRSSDLTEREAVELQRSEWARLFRTADHAEALTAFFEKRPGRFERR